MGGAAGRDGFSVEMYGLRPPGNAAEKAGREKSARNPGSEGYGIEIRAVKELLPSQLLGYP